MRQAFFKSLAILLVLGTNLSLMAQQPIFQSFDTRAGLCSNEVYDVFQDSKGYVWIATAKGVSRMDGHSIVNFYTQEYSNEGVSNLIEDAKGRIWFSSFWGQFFYIENDSLHPFKSFNTLVVNVAFIKKTQKLYIPVQNNHLKCIDLVTLKTEDIASPIKDTTLFIHQNIGANSEAVFIYFSTTLRTDQKGDIYHYYKFQDNHFSEIHAQTISHSLVIEKFGISNFNYYIYLDGKNYFLTQKYALEITGDTTRRIPLSKQLLLFMEDAIVSSIRVLGANELLINTYNKGALLVDKNFNIQSNSGLGLMSDYSLSNGIKDREGNYWFGTLKKGVMLIPDIHSRSVFNTRNRLLTAMEIADSDHLILGYDDGTLTYYSITSGFEKLLGKANKSVKKIARQRSGVYYIIADLLYELSGNIPSLDKGRPLTADNKNASLGADGFAIFNTSHYTLADLTGFSSEIKSKFFKKWGKMGYWKVYERADGNYLSHFILNESRAFGLAVSESEDLIYTSASTGLTYITPELKKVILYRNKNIFSNSMLLIGKILYCATDNGLMRIDGTSVQDILTVKNGLQDNHVFNIKLYGKYLIILNQKGIDYLDLTTGQIQRILGQDEILGEEITDFLLIGTSLYYSTESGLKNIPFHRDKLLKMKPLIHLDGIFVNNVKWRSDGNELKLTYRENNIRFQFTGIHFRSGKTLIYKYRLLGLGDTAWIEKPGTDQYLEFDNLRSGEYYFEIKVLDIFGNESSVISKRICISRPFWNTWWFYLICALGLGATVVFYNRYTIQRKQKESLYLLEKARIEKELQQSQLSSLKVQMNPHFMFNALNSIQEFIMTNEKKLANQYLGKFSDLMRMTLDMSQDERVVLADEIKVLRLYLDLEQLRFGEELKVSMIISEQIDADQIQIPSMLIQPYVENALKHGLLHRKGEKHLNIQFGKKLKENVLICIVEDDGIGRIKSEEIKQFRNRAHRSFASSATKKRLELLNEGRENAISVAYTDKTAGNGESAGTLVTIEIPYS